MDVRTADMAAICIPKAGFPLEIFFCAKRIFLLSSSNYFQMVQVERPKTNEKFASRDKNRKWKTGIMQPRKACIHRRSQRSKNSSYVDTCNFKI
jgi:hypothetical protein